MILKRLRGPCPCLSPDKLLQIGGRQPVAGAPLAALGPGTGLGMAVSIPHATGHLVLSSEGGHSTMAGSSLREDAVIGYLRRRLGHVSAEHVLSGNGLENLYEALAALDDIQAAKAPRCRNYPGRGRGYLFDEPRRHRHVLRDARDCRRQSRAHARCEGRRYLLPEAFCVTCPNILPARNFARVLKKKGGSASISNRFRPISFWTRMPHSSACIVLAEVEGIG